MPAEGLRHAILGAGGVGGFIAAVLGRAGDAITLLLREDALASYPETLTLESPFGGATIRPARAARLERDVDVLWVTVKATQLDASLAAVADPRRARTVVPFLNGIDHVAALRARFGHDRVVPATIAIESERVAPGRIVHRAPFAVVAFSAAAEERLGGVAAALARAGCTCSFDPDETSMMWRKLVLLAPIALSTTAAAAPLGDVLARPGGTIRVEALVQEACAVARAAGARVDPAETLRRLHILPASMRSSMQKDVAAGFPSELDAIGGPILRGADRLGVPVPVTAQVVSEVRSRIAGR